MLIILPLNSLNVVYRVYNQFGGNVGEFVEFVKSKSSQLVLLHVYCCMHACVRVVDELIVLTSFQSMGHCFNKLFP